MEGYDPHIEVMTLPDVDVVYVMETLSYKSPLSKTELTRLIMSGEACIIATQGDKVLGHGIALFRGKGRKHLELHSLVVGREYRRNVIGTTMLDHFKQYLGPDCFKITAWIPGDCLEACCFLRANDFICSEIKQDKRGRDVYLFEYFY